MATSSDPSLALGTRAPDFTLPDVSTGESVTLADVTAGRPLLVMFLCRHCPYVRHVTGELARLGRDYGARGVAIVAVSSNDAEAYPEDSPESLAEMARECGFVFPVCHDGDQRVARAYGAACTPEFFVFDRGLRLVYHGQLDDSRPGNGRPVDGRDLRSALDAVLDGRPVAGRQKPSVGCSIKWRRAVPA